jgi:SAM-dependent methyltransferase
MTNQTIKYYKENAKEFSEDTYDLEMDEVWHKFTSLLGKNSKILDAGCGSARDSNHFLSLGFDVVSMDPVTEFNSFAKERFNIDILNLSFQEIEFENEFNAIWACASLLHVPMNEMKDVFSKLNKAIKSSGLLYCSFKCGDYEKTKKGRLFSSFTEETFNQFLKENPLFSIKELWTTQDKRVGREDEKWLNLLLKK